MTLASVQVATSLPASSWPGRIRRVSGLTDVCHSTMPSMLHTGTGASLLQTTNSATTPSSIGRITTTCSSPIQSPSPKRRLLPGDAINTPSTHRSGPNQVGIPLRTDAVSGSLGPAQMLQGLDERLTWYGLTMAASPSPLQPLAAGFESVSTDVSKYAGLHGGLDGYTGLMGMRLSDGINGDWAPGMAPGSGTTSDTTDDWVDSNHTFVLSSRPEAGKHLTALTTAVTNLSSSNQCITSSGFFSHGASSTSPFLGCLSPGLEPEPDLFQSSDVNSPNGPPVGLPPSRPHSAAHTSIGTVRKGASTTTSMLTPQTLMHSGQTGVRMGKRSLTHGDVECRRDEPKEALEVGVLSGGGESSWRDVYIAQ
ncbi:unnamed protein product [Protopolystoma xenopodis]|uniref:Uncharacterized protein n=1 Tax=Protopolystoma xenopodis TaxID=117903 RepID=A0A448WP20_9PLAT|nr:unnamed protein product [Protopolystoma xenopodis]